MRKATFLSALVLCLTASVDAQTKKPPPRLERFDVSGLPAEPTNDAERQLFLLLRAHRKGDLNDATRIHMLLAQYYKDIGDKARSDDCTRLAADAYEVGSRMPPETARSPGKPPFSPERTLRRTFVFTDELNVAHTWEFYLDGTFSHAVSNQSSDVAPNDTGWYTRSRGQIRLWQLTPSVDRTVSFELLGPDGSDGAVLDGVRMKAGS
jgi:hypothetical protein